MTKFVLPAVVAIWIALASVSLAEFAVVEPPGTGSFSIADWNDRQLRQGFGFRVDVDKTQLDDRELRDHLAAMGLNTSSGDRVRSLAFSREHNIFIGTSIDNNAVGINLVQVSEDTTQFVVQVRDQETGQFRISNPEDLAVLTLDGDPLPFTIRSIEEVPSIRISLALLIDRSGSMRGSLDEAVTAIQEFADLLPANAECLLLSFNHTYTDHGSGFVDCRKAVRMLSNLEPGGGTDIFSPLLHAFDQLGRLPNHLRMIAIVTDGNDHGPLSENDVLPRKTAPVAILWRGWWSDAELKGIADTYLHSSADFKTAMRQFLGGLNASVQGQFVVTVPNQHANEEAMQ